jgi:hypothetical protein
MINQLLAELELLKPVEEFLCGLELIPERMNEKKIKKLGFENYLGNCMILEGYRNHDPDEISLRTLIDKLKTYDLIEGKGILEMGIEPEKSKCDKLIVIRVEGEKFYIVDEYTTAFEPGEYCLPVYNVKQISELPCLTQCRQLSELYRRIKG